MTDQYHAMVALAPLPHTHEARREVFHDFYNRFNADDVVITKWFQLQSQTLPLGVLIPEVLENKKFDRTQPNKVVRDCSEGVRLALQVTAHNYIECYSYYIVYEDDVNVSFSD